jgi:hypothetical protein
MSYDLLTVEEDLVEYSDFEEVASVSRAKSFITAAKRWMILCAAQASNQGSSLSRSKAEVMQMLARAHSFVSASEASSSASSRVRYFGISQGFR